MPLLILGSSEKPAAVFIPNFSSGKGLVIDTAVTCPLQPKFFHNSSISQGYACNEYAQSVKVKNFGNKVSSEGHIDLVDRMISSNSTRFNQSRNIAKKFFFEKMSCVLMKHIARSVSSRCSDFFLAN